MFILSLTAYCPSSSLVSYYDMRWHKHKITMATQYKIKTKICLKRFLFHTTEILKVLSCSTLQPDNLDFGDHLVLQ